MQSENVIWETGKRALAMRHGRDLAKARRGLKKGSSILRRDEETNQCKEDGHEKNSHLEREDSHQNNHAKNSE